MMFDVPEDLEVIDSEVHKIGEELNVAISIKPKHRQGCKSVLIKAQERNASSIYAARHRLLKMDEDEELLVVADVPESYKVQPLPQQVVDSMGKNSATTLDYPWIPLIFTFFHFLNKRNERPEKDTSLSFLNDVSWTSILADQ